MRSSGCAGCGSGSMGRRRPAKPRITGTDKVLGAYVGRERSGLFSIRGVTGTKYYFTASGPDRVQPVFVEDLDGLCRAGVIYAGDLPAEETEEEMDRAGDAVEADQAG